MTFSVIVSVCFMLAVTCVSHRNRTGDQHHCSCFTGVETQAQRMSFPDCPAGPGQQQCSGSAAHRCGTAASRRCGYPILAELSTLRNTVRQCCWSSNEKHAEKPSLSPHHVPTPFLPQAAGSSSTVCSVQCNHPRLVVCSRPCQPQPPVGKEGEEAYACGTGWGMAFAPVSCRKSRWGRGEGRGQEMRPGWL